MAGEVDERGRRRSDGAVCYRIDSQGARVAVLPATCRCGVHRLAITGYRATEGGGVLRLRCDACAAAGSTKGTWLLSTQGELVNRAELDDAPYRAVFSG